MMASVDHIEISRSSILDLQNPLYFLRNTRENTKKYYKKLVLYVGRW